MLSEALTGSASDSSPVSNAVVFTYLSGYDPGVDRPMGSDRQLSVKYVAEQDVFGVRATFDEGPSRLSRTPVTGWNL